LGLSALSVLRVFYAETKADFLKYTHDVYELWHIYYLRTAA